MNLFRLLSGTPAESPAERIASLEHKLTEVKAGRYLIKASDRASNLSELEQKLERELARLRAK